MNKILKTVLIAICVLTISISVFFENIDVSIKLVLFGLYCLSFIIYFIKEREYDVFGNKFINILYSIIYIYFPLSIWYFVFFEFQNTAYHIIEIVAGVGFIGFSIAKYLTDN